MKAFEIVGWTNGTGCAFCPDCEPSECDEKSPIFASNEGWNDWTCDSCHEPLDPDYVNINEYEPVDDSDD